MSEQIKAALRFAIVSVARVQAWAGAHYLNGTVGNTPGNSDGYKSRHLKIAGSADYDELAVRAAEWSGERCKGRCDKVGGETLPPGQATKEAIEKYIAANAHKDPSLWPAFRAGCYPRRLHGKGSSIYVGEDCLGTRHFDCIGLVNWAIGCVLAKQPGYSIQQWNTGAKGLAAVMDPPAVGSLQNADVLVRLGEREHIGLATSGGEVIEAKGSEIGVVVSDYRREKWTKLARIHDSYLKAG